MRSVRSISSMLIFTVAVALALVLPSLVQHGMFMDGTQYACVARNLASGQGSFWFPHLSDSWLRNGCNHFLEHLSFTYFLQSIFFKVFGESIYTERIYCFCCLLLSIFLINKIWKLLPFKSEALKRYSWLPILLWITCGSVFWAFCNNMLEITVTVFVLLSFYFTLKTIYSDSLQYLYLILSGISVFLACFSKGLVGLFPVAGFLIFCFTTRVLPIKRALFYTTVMVLLPVLLFAALYTFNQKAHENLHFYFVDRLLFRINNDPLVENRFTVLFWVITDMFVPLIILIFCPVLYRIKKINNPINSERKGLILFFLLTGLAGVVPLTFTLVQRAVYFVPALPFFALGISLFLVEGIEEIKSRLASKINYKWFRFTSIAALISVFVVCMFLAGKTSRDEELLTDVKKICDRLPAGTNVVAPNDVYEEWYTQFYLLRYGKIVTWPDSHPNTKFYLIRKQENTQYPIGYHPVVIGLKNFELLEIQQ